MTEKAISAGAVDYFDRLSSVSRLELGAANGRGREGFRPIIFSDVVPLDARTGRVERLLGSWLAPLVRAVATRRATTAVILPQKSVLNLCVNPV